MEKKEKEQKKKAVWVGVTPHCQHAKVRLFQWVEVALAITSRSGIERRRRRQGGVQGPAACCCTASTTGAEGGGTRLAGCSVCRIPRDKPFHVSTSVHSLSDHVHDFRGKVVVVRNLGKRLLNRKRGILLLGTKKPHCTRKKYGRVDSCR